MTLLDFAKGFIESFIKPYETIIIFDCYNDNSIKSHERKRRIKGIIPLVYTLGHDTVLPTREVVMKCEQNKKSLIKFICDIDHNQPMLRLIGEGSEFSHEEADVSIISYILKIRHKKTHIQILTDDTDIFVLLLYFLLDPQAICIYNNEEI